MLEKTFEEACEIKRQIATWKSVERAIEKNARIHFSADNCADLTDGAQQVMRDALRSYVKSELGKCEIAFDQLDDNYS